MYDFEISFYLYKMAKIQTIFLDSNYKAKAYYSAAMALDAYDCYVEKMYQKKSLKQIPFIGDKIEKSIIEIIETGAWAELNKYERIFDIRDYSLLLSHGLPISLIKKLMDMSIKSAYTLLNEKYLNDLYKYLNKNEMKKILSFLDEFKRNKGKYLLAYGDCLANEIITFLTGIKGITSTKISGQLALAKEKISNIDIDFCYIGDWEFLIEKIKNNNRFVDICENEFDKIEGKTKFGIPFTLRFIKNIISKEFSRVDKYNIENYIKGDLHSHTSWTDGIHSIEQMAQAAIDKKYEYLGITDHSFSMRIAHGLSESQALSQIDKIKEWNKTNKFKILSGIEVDILSDGTLDYSDDILCQFDFVIAAIHSNINQEPLELYNRLEKALSNPYVNILAHPTSRLLGRPGVLFCERLPYKLTIQSIIDLCKTYGVALEVNCFPERLDLNEENVKKAIEQGVKISLGTDSHSLAHLRNIKYGINILNKINVPKDMLLNTYSYKELIDFFKSKINCIKNKTNVNKGKKDFYYYFSNNSDIIDGKKTVIGIDLTGSEDKESGWAYLSSNIVECKRIKSDKDLIESIKLYNPDIVSIDSPLAYPKGRCCSRKDCRCSKYGIMRDSEKMLRHFGITVYPCLIDSMVNLTNRGIQLAKILRNMGYKVIESYPGVAQDILMIPRKGKTIEQFTHLKQGLANFGICGDLLTNVNISHDEVDAVTSALVGYFYLNNQYVGLGNEYEDVLIIPRVQEEILNRRLIIGLCGETGAGKTTVASYLKFKYGMKTFRYSQVIEDIYHINNKKELQELGARIAKNTEEQRQLTKYMIRNMKDETSYVVDGLRHLEDYEELQKYFGNDFILLYIECRYMNRYKRYNNLHFHEVTIEDFKLINNHKSEKDIVLLQFKSNYRIDNNQGFKDLRLQVDDIIQGES